MAEEKSELTPEQQAVSATIDHLVYDFIYGTKGSTSNPDEKYTKIIALKALSTESMFPPFDVYYKMYENEVQLQSIKSNLGNPSNIEGITQAQSAEAKKTIQARLIYLSDYELDHFNLRGQFKAEFPYLTQPSAPPAEDDGVNQPQPSAPSEEVQNGKTWFAALNQKQQQQINTQWENLQQAQGSRGIGLKVDHFARF